MAYQTGDIAINTKWPGHVMMVLEEHQNENKIQIIHGQKSGNFHIQPMQYEINNALGYLIDTPTWVFRPKWSPSYTDAQILMKKRDLNEIARGIARSAKYGLYRAVRLFVGSSEYGPEARARLAKYQMRKVEFLAGGGKFVSTITCAEAVILCYQLAFFGTENSPCFIKKDGAHTMPNTLKEYLERNWTTVKTGT